MDNNITGFGTFLHRQYISASKHELCHSNDSVMSLRVEDENYDTNVENEETWCYKNDTKVNMAIGELLLNNRDHSNRS